MIEDGRALADGTRIEADVGVIGCGPVGLALVHALARPGLRIAVFESGGLTQARETDRLGIGESVGYSYPGLWRTRVRGIGGTSLHWELDKPGDEGWTARPLDAIDFEERPGLVHSGWPIRRADLDPYYLQAQAVCKLGPFAYEADDWAEGPNCKQLPLDPDRVVTRMFQRGAGTFAHFVRELETLAGVTVFHHTTATELVVNESGRVVEAVALTRPGTQLSLAAGLYVVAAGGIENARLLLLSNRARPAGLGNGHDLVGRYFMERLATRAGALVPARPSLLGATGLYESHFVGTTRVQGVLALNPDLVRSEGLLNAALWLQPRPRAYASEGVRSLITLIRAPSRRPRPPGLLRHLRNVVANLDDIGRVLVDRGRQGSLSQDAVFQLGIQAEQSPNPESRITLSPKRDRLGLRQPRLDWRPTEGDRASMQRTLVLIDGELQKRGVGWIARKFGEEDPPSMFRGNFHHMGTTRMADRPEEGVVDANCRLHGSANLFLAGGSVFSTSGYANPTLTMVAMSLRLANHLGRKLDGVERPWE